MSGTMAERVRLMVEAVLQGVMPRLQQMEAQNVTLNT